MLTKDHLVLAKVLLRCISFHLLHSHLILKEFFSRGFQSLLLDRSWHVAFLEDASWYEYIIIDFVLVLSHFVCWKKESVEVILIFPSLLAKRQGSGPIDVDYGSFSNLARFILDDMTHTIHRIILAAITIVVTVIDLHLLNMRHEFFFWDRLAKPIGPKLRPGDVGQCC